VRLYHRSILVLSVVIALVGVALLVRTAARGGGTTGFVLGGLFLALGVARFTLERKRTRA
jgi:NO-binding membrane sensor protein with MHYT domain